VWGHVRQRLFLSGIFNQGAHMKKTLFVGGVLLFGVSISLTVGAERAAAQGPAGVGASAAAQDSSHSLHSLNPIRWVKKDSKNSTDALGSRSPHGRLATEVFLGDPARFADSKALATRVDEGKRTGQVRVT
jgi:hypothetical protein